MPANYSTLLNSDLDYLVYPGRFERRKSGKTRMKRIKGTRKYTKNSARKQIKGRYLID
jgi:hypothetical protein